MDEKIYLRLLYGMEEIPDGLARIIGRNPCYDLAGLPSPKLKEEIEGFIRYRSTQVSIGRMQGDKQFYNKVRRFLKECATAKSSLRDKAPETWVKQFRTWMFKEHIPLYYRSRGPTGKENISKAREIGYFERMLKFTAVDARREEEKDVWELDKLEIEHRENPIKRVRTLNFTRISQDGIRQELKKGIYLNLQGEAIAFVLTATAVAELLGLSALLTTMAMGAVFANFCKQSAQVMELTDRFTNPIYMMFFVLSGAGLNLSILPSIGLVGVIYVVVRVLGKMAGAWFGATLMHGPAEVRRYLGPALLPQAGVAIGLTVVAQQVVPQYAEVIRAVILCGTLIYELIGPGVAKWALQKAGEIEKGA